MRNKTAVPLLSTRGWFQKCIISTDSHSKMPNFTAERNITFTAWFVLYTKCFFYIICPFECWNKKRFNIWFKKRTWAKLARHLFGVRTSKTAQKNKHFSDILRDFCRWGTSDNRHWKYYWVWLHLIFSSLSCATSHIIHKRLLQSSANRHFTNQCVSMTLTILNKLLLLWNHTAVQTVVFFPKHPSVPHFHAFAQCFAGFSLTWCQLPCEINFPGGSEASWC